MSIKSLKIIALVIVVFFVARLGHALYVLNKSSISYNAPKDYSALFSHSVDQTLTLDCMFNSKRGQPIAMYRYKSYYHVFVYKIRFTNTSTLLSMIKEEEIPKPDKRDFLIKGGFTSIPIGEFKIQEPLDSCTVDDDLYLTFGCDSLHTVMKNDTVIDYSVFMNNFSLKYSIDGQTDIQVVNNKNNDKHEFNFLFLKKQNDVYLLFMTPINSYDFLRGDSILDLIK